MRKLYLELTSCCNLHCLTCFRNSWRQAPTHMEEQVFSALLEQIQDLPALRHVVIGGIGEPMLAPLFPEALRSLGSFHVTVTTNVTLLKEDQFSLLCDTVDVMTVSIDGLQEAFSRIRNTGLTEITERLHAFDAFARAQGKRRPVLHLQFVASQDTIDDAFGVVALAARLGAQRLIISHLVPQTETAKDKALYRRYANPELKQLFLELINFSRQKGVYVALPHYELKTERECDFQAQSAAYVTSTGDVTPCYRLAHDATEYVLGRCKQVRQFRFGHILERPIADIWSGLPYTEFRKTLENHQYPSCVDCDLVEGCDLVRSTEMDCYGTQPSCADCLWSRRFVQCP